MKSLQQHLAESLNESYSAEDENLFNELKHYISSLPKSISTVFNAEIDLHIENGKMQAFIKQKNEYVNDLVENLSTTIVNKPSNKSLKSYCIKLLNDLGKINFDNGLTNLKSPIEDLQYLAKVMKELYALNNSLGEFSILLGVKNNRYFIHIPLLKQNVGIALDNLSSHFTKDFIFDNQGGKTYEIRFKR